jgi:hypothetical protein
VGAPANNTKAKRKADNTLRTIASEGVEDKRMSEERQAYTPAREFMQEFLYQMSLAHDVSDRINT